MPDGTAGNLVKHGGVGPRRKVLEMSEGVDWDVIC